MRIFYNIYTSLEDLNFEYYNGEYNTQYNSNFDSMTYAVSVVEWDNTISASSFNAANQPPEDGARIAKNRWSDKWGDECYFYLSSKIGYMYYKRCIAFFICPSVFH